MIAFCDHSITRNSSFMTNRVGCLRPPEESSDGRISLAVCSTHLFMRRWHSTRTLFARGISIDGPPVTLRHVPSMITASPDCVTWNSFGFVRTSSARPIAASDITHVTTTTHCFMYRLRSPAYSVLSRFPGSNQVLSKSTTRAGCFSSASPIISRSKVPCNRGRKHE